MSSVLKPIGPEDKNVYWKRRALVAGGVVVILFVLWLLLRGGGGETPVPVESTSSQTSAPASPSTSTSGSASASPSSSPSSTLENACADSSITVETTTSQPTYLAGDNPEITMAIVNKGATACKRDVGSAANTIVVSSGGVRIWSSDDVDCSSSAPDVVTLDPGQRAAVTVTWPRTTSEPGCKPNQPAAKPGSYEAVGTNGKVSSKPTTFAIQ